MQWECAYLPILGYYFILITSYYSNYLRGFEIKPNYPTISHKLDYYPPLDIRYENQNSSRLIQNDHNAKLSYIIIGHQSNDTNIDQHLPLLPIRIKLSNSLKNLLAIKSRNHRGRIFYSNQLLYSDDKVAPKDLDKACFDAIPALSKSQVPTLKTFSLIPIKAHTPHEIHQEIKNSQDIKYFWECTFDLISRDNVGDIPMNTKNQFKQVKGSSIKFDPEKWKVVLNLDLCTKYWPKSLDDLMLNTHKEISTTFSYHMLSFYSFFKIEKPTWLIKKLSYIWNSLGILGRVYVANEGINAQLAIPCSSLDKFNAALSILFDHKLSIALDRVIPHDEYWYGESQPQDNSINMKRHQPPFTTLHIRHRPHIVADGWNETLDLNRSGDCLSPPEWHEEINNKHDQVILDCRNNYEFDIGHFEDACPLNTTMYREAFGQNGALKTALSGIPKDRKILMYCTGGIRCVKTAAFAIQKLGFNNVYRLDGGIVAYHNYIQNIKSQGNQITSKYKGSNYVFDNRFSERITDDIYGLCNQCGEPCNEYINCNNGKCHQRFLQCYKCNEKHMGCCSEQCKEENSKQVKVLSKQVRHADDNSLEHLKTDYLDTKESLSSSLEKVNNKDAAAPQRLPTPIENYCNNSRISIDNHFKGHLLSRGIGTITMEMEANRWSENSLSPLIKSLQTSTHELYPSSSQMASEPSKGCFLSFLSRLTKPKLILDIGTFTGLSAHYLAEGLSENSKLITIETGQDCLKLARRFISESPYNRQINIVNEQALSFLKTYSKNLRENSRFFDDKELDNSPYIPFDLIFLDADKKAYNSYIDVILYSNPPLLSKENGLLIIDNTLWRNRPQKSHNTQRMNSIHSSNKRLHERFRDDKNIEEIIIPAWDGFSLVKFSNK